MNSTEISGSMHPEVPLALVGISHHTASVEVRDRVSLSEDEQKSMLPQLRERFGAEGALIMSTCNRTEVYLSGQDLPNRITGIREWLDQIKGTSYFTDDNITYRTFGPGAVRHFFALIAGLDSQIIGEQQITTQVKEGYNLAHEVDVTDALINKLFNYGMQAKKRVYNETLLYDGTVSVSFAGVELARKIFNSLENKEILLIGAGKTAELAAYHFTENGAKNINVANRSLDRARELASKTGGRVWSLDELPSALKSTDIAISATGSTGYILDAETMRRIGRERHHRPLFLIDLAVPRDIEPEAGEIDGVYLYNLDDLEAIVKSNLENRRREIPKAMKIVDEVAAEFLGWLSTYSMTAIIGRLKEHLDALRMRELERMKKRLPSNGSLKEIDELTQGIMNKLIRQHMKSLKRHAGDPAIYQQHVDLIYNLYELDRDE